MMKEVKNVTIYPRKDGLKERWAVNVTYYVDRSKKIMGRKRYVVGRYKEQANIEKRRLFKEGLDDGIKDKSNTTVAEYIPEYIAYKSTDEWRPKTIERNKITLRYLNEKLGKRLVNTITALDIERIKKELIERNRKRNGINREIDTIKNFFRMAYAYFGYMEKDIAKDINKLETVDEDKHPEWLREHEITKILDYARPDFRYYSLIFALLNTGLRIGEIRQLEWEQVNLNERKLTVLARTSKSKRTRSIYITDPIFDLLFKIKEYNISQKPKDEKFVFLNGKHELIKDNSLLKRVKLMYRKCGINPNYNVHTFRHTFASHLAIADVPLHKIKELLGHRDYKTTLRYAHLSKSSLDQATKKLPLAFAG